MRMKNRSIFFYKKLKFKEKEGNVNEICLIERIEIMKMNLRCEISIDQKFIAKKKLSMKSKL